MKPRRFVVRLFLIVAFLVQATLAEEAAIVPKDKVALLVRKETYRQLKAEIDQYKRDVEERFPVELEIVADHWWSPVDVRARIRRLLQERAISGAVLVGAIPMHRFFMHEFPNPNPLYYEAPEARFADSNAVGFDDTCVDPPVPRIWVANIRSSEFERDDQPALEGLRTFFRKTHVYYTGALPVERRALAVTASDWPDGARHFARTTGKPLFGEEGVDVLDPKDATLESLRAKLSKHTYAMLYIQVHSTWDRQEMGGGDLTSQEIGAFKTGALFVVNHGCSNCNWMRNAAEERPKRNTAMSWIFGQSAGQALMGNVRTGMVYGQEALYERLRRGDYLGKAYLAAKQSAEAEMRRGYPKGDTVSGVTFLGNPFLRIAPAAVPAGRTVAD